MRLSRVVGIVAALLAFLGAGGAEAADPVPWETGFQPAATPVMRMIESFNTGLTVVIGLICLVVLGLLAYVIWRFNDRANPNPSRTTHNTVVEVVWTVVPILILVGIAIPSFKLLYFEGDIPKADLTIKAIGHQWYWSYEYPDNGNFTFDANLVADADLKPGQLRLLTTDNPLVVPAGATVRLQTTSTDVIHSWAIPSFGVKMDAFPGRLNETWFKVDEPGIYYGQCSELCGNGHGFMPIMVKAVSKADYDKWVAEAKTKFAKADGAAATQLAAAPND
ncbi:MAG TPA: cytochrome c oxidase subunit II [Dongiaceae bacterium]|nr:cytochrome c oxidase subunit II [Dongiaceae bacterium]